VGRLFFPHRLKLLPSVSFVFRPCLFGLSGHGTPEARAPRGATPFWQHTLKTTPSRDCLPRGSRAGLVTVCSGGRENRESK